MSTYSLIRKLVRRGSSLGRSITARRGRRPASVIETLEGRTLFSLLGIIPGNPGGFVSGPPGSLTYVAATQNFDAVGVPLTFFDAAGVSHNIDAPQGFDLHIKIDNSGNLIGSGSQPQDLVITGSVDVTGDNVADYTGTLITGKIQAFGSDTDGVTGYFDARLTVTGGSMATLFASNDIGLAISAEPSDVNTLFTGDWSQDFSMQTKGTFGVIPGTGNPPLNITGHKFKDVAGNGLGGGDDVPLPNWTINLYADSNNSGVLDAGDTLVDTTTTAAGTGAYAFNNLPAGKYFVKEAGQPGWVATGPASGQYTVDLTSTDANNIDFANYKCSTCTTTCGGTWTCGSGSGSGGSCGSWTWSCFKGHWGHTTTGSICTTGTIPTLSTATSSLAGSIYVDCNGNGRQDCGEAGIGGVKVTLTGTDLLGNLVTKTATTNCYGDYKFTCLIAGNYTVTESSPGGCYIDGKDYAGSNGGTVCNDVIKNITVPPCSDLKCYDFTEYKTSSLCGKIFNDKDGDGTQDCRENGLSGVTVKLTGTDFCGNSVCVTVTTDCNGNFNFCGLRPGTYTLIETVLSGYNTTKNHAGSEGGCLASDRISNITIECGDSACGYSFGQKQRSSC